MKKNITIDFINEALVDMNAFESGYELTKKRLWEEIETRLNLEPELHNGVMLDISDLVSVAEELAFVQGFRVGRASRA